MKDKAVTDTSAPKADAEHTRSIAPASASKKKSFGWLLWTVIVIIVFGIVVGFYYPSFYKDADAYIDNLVADIMGEDKLAPLSIAQTKKQVAPTPSAAANSEPIVQSIMFTDGAEPAADEDMLDEEVIVAEPEPPASLSKTDDKKELAELNKRIDSLEEKLTTATKEKQLGAALVMAAMRLKETALAGDDFSTELAAVAKLGNGNENITTKLAELDNFKNGITTKTALKNQFSDLIKLAFTQVDESAEQGFFDKTAAKLKSLIVIRKIQDDEANIYGVDAVILAAEKAVKDDDLSAAAKRLDTLGEAQKKVFAKWQSDVKNLAEVTADVDAIIAFALNEIANDDKGQKQ